MIGSRKEGTPRIPVTGYIIGDRPKRELDFTSKTLIILKRTRKSKLVYRMDIQFHKENESYSEGKATKD